VTAVLIEILEAADSAAVPSLSDDIGAVALVLQSMCDIVHRGTHISSSPLMIAVLRIERAVVLPADVVNRVARVSLAILAQLPRNKPP
jgi:hypothetical protein